MTESGDNVGCLGALFLAVPTCTAAMLVVLALLAFGGDVPISTLSPKSASTVATEFAVVACTNLLFLLCSSIWRTKLCYRILALLFILSSVLPIFWALPIFGKGPQGAGSAAAGIGFLISSVVLATGISAAVCAIGYAKASFANRLTKR